MFDQVKTSIQKAFWQDNVGDSVFLLIAHLKELLLIMEYSAQINLLL